MAFMLLFLAQLADIKKLLTHSIRLFIIYSWRLDFLSMTFCCQDREEGCL